jgi:hypothetical protein
MDTRQQLRAFVEEASFLDVVAIAELAGLQYAVLYRWMAGAPSSYTEGVVRTFLDGDGKRIMEISQKLKGERKDRIALHQERAEIFKKARIHTTGNQRVPSPVTN